MSGITDEGVWILESPFRLDLHTNRLYPWAEVMD